MATAGLSDNNGAVQEQDKKKSIESGCGVNREQRAEEGVCVTTVTQDVNQFIHKLLSR